jgi:hypothetical protein
VRRWLIKTKPSVLANDGSLPDFSAAEVQECDECCVEETKIQQTKQMPTPAHNLDFARTKPLQPPSTISKKKLDKSKVSTFFTIESSPS